MMQRMEALFISRMALHQELVKKNLLAMHSYRGIKLALLLERANNHDASKYLFPERDSYIWINWKYKCEREKIAFTYPKAVEETVMQGWRHHITTNAHHPEAHANENKMQLIDMIEMVCDWTAISQEINCGVGSALVWAEQNIESKWNFSNKNRQLIFSIIKELDERNQYQSNRLMRKNEDD